MLHCEEKIKIQTVRNVCLVKAAKCTANLVSGYYSSQLKQLLLTDKVVIIAQFDVHTEVTMQLVCVLHRLYIKDRCFSGSEQLSRYKKALKLHYFHWPALQQAAPLAGLLIVEPPNAVCKISCAFQKKNKKKQGPESRYHHILIKSSHTETPWSSLFTGENIPSCQTKEIKI